MLCQWFGLKLPEKQDKGEEEGGDEEYLQQKDKPGLGGFRAGRYMGHVELWQMNEVQASQNWES